MAARSWNDHIFEVRCEALPRGFMRLWARADGGRYELVESNIVAAEQSEFARQNPGSTWLPLANLPLVLREADRILPCRVEFDVSPYQLLGRKIPYRYTIFVEETEVLSGEVTAEFSAGSIVLALTFWAVFALVIYVLLARG